MSNRKFPIRLFVQRSPQKNIFLKVPLKTTWLRNLSHHSNAFKGSHAVNIFKNDFS